MTEGQRGPDWERAPVSDPGPPERPAGEAESEIIDGIIRREGGFVDHPADRGGPTKYGVTRQTLQRWRGGPVTIGDVRGLEESEARRIYERLYLAAPGFDRAVGERKLLSLLVDCAVQHGPRRAARWLQAAAGAAVDGVIGPRTIEAVKAAGEKVLYKRVLAARCRFYGNIVARDPSQAAFAAGWAERLAEFIEEAA